MAESQTLNTVFKSEVNDFIKDVGRIKSAFKEIQTAVANINKSAASVTGALGKMGGVSQPIDKSKKSVSEFEKVVNKMTDSAKKLVTAVDSIGKGVDKVGDKLKKNDKNVSDAEKGYGRLGKAIGQLREKMGQVLTYGVAATGVYALINALKEGAAEIITFSQSLKNLEAISGEGFDQILSMGVKMKDVARDTKFSTSEISEGMVLLVQSGLDASEAMDTIRANAELATGTLSKMEVTTDLLTTAMRAFELSSVESGRIADVMANAINKSKLTVDKLRIAFNYIGVTAKQAGLSLEDIAATMMLLANNGLRASTIGTGLRQVLSKMISPSTKLAAAMQAQGVALEKINPKIVGYQSALENLRNILLDAETQTVNMAKAYGYFGLRGMQASAVLVKNMTDFESMVSHVMEFGKTAEMAAIQAEGLEVKFKNLADRFKLLFIALGEAGIEKIIGIVVDSLRAVVSSMESFISVFGSAILKVTAFVAVYKTVNAILKSDIWLTLSKYVGVYALELSKATKSQGVFIATSGAMTSMLSKLAAWFKSFVIDNPFVVAIGGAIALMEAVKALVGLNEKLIQRANRLSAEYQKNADVLTMYRDILSDVTDQSLKFQSILGRFATENKDMANELERMLDMEDLFQFDPANFERLKNAFTELSQIKLQESLDESAAALERMRIRQWNASREVEWYTKLLKVGLIGTKTFREETSSHTETLKEYDAVVKSVVLKLRDLVAAQTKTRDSASEYIESMGISSDTAGKMEESLTKALDEIAAASERMAVRTKTAIEKLPGPYAQFYDSLDAMGKVDFVEFQNNLDKKTVAFRNHARAINVEESEIQSSIAAMRSKEFADFRAMKEKEAGILSDAENSKLRYIQDFVDQANEEYARQEISQQELQERLVGYIASANDTIRNDTKETADYRIKFDEQISESGLEANRVYLEGVKQIYLEIRDTITGQLDEMESRLTETKNKLAGATKKLADAERAYHEDIEKLQRKTMSNEELWLADREKAHKLLNDGIEKNDIDLVNRARDLFKDLARDVTDENRNVIKSVEETKKEAEAGLGEAYKATVNILQGQKKEFEENIKTIEGHMKNAEAMLDRYKDKIIEVSKTKLTLDTRNLKEEFEKAGFLLSKLKDSFEDALTIELELEADESAFERVSNFINKIRTFFKEKFQIKMEFIGKASPEAPITETIDKVSGKLNEFYENFEKPHTLKIEFGDTAIRLEEIGREFNALDEASRVIAGTFQKDLNAGVGELDALVAKLEEAGATIRKIQTDRGTIIDIDSESENAKKYLSIIKKFMSESNNLYEAQFKKNDELAKSHVGRVNQLFENLDPEEIVVDFVGRGSLVRPLSEKTNEMKAKITDFISSVEESSPEMKADFSPISESLEELADAADDARKRNEKLKKSLASTENIEGQKRIVEEIQENNRIILDSEEAKHAALTKNADQAAKERLRTERKFNKEIKELILGNTKADRAKKWSEEQIRIEREGNSELVSIEKDHSKKIEEEYKKAEDRHEEIIEQADYRIEQADEHHKDSMTAREKEFNAEMLALELDRIKSTQDTYMKLFEITGDPEILETIRQNNIKLLEEEKKKNEEVLGDSELAQTKYLSDVKIFNRKLMEADAERAKQSSDLYKELYAETMNPEYLSAYESYNKKIIDIERSKAEEIIGDLDELNTIMLRKIREAKEEELKIRIDVNQKLLDETDNEFYLKQIDDLNREAIKLETDSLMESMKISMEKRKILENELESEKRKGLLSKRYSDDEWDAKRENLQKIVGEESRTEELILAKVRNLADERLKILRDRIKKENEELRKSYEMTGDETVLSRIKDNNLKITVAEQKKADDILRINAELNDIKTRQDKGFFERTIDNIIKLKNQFMSLFRVGDGPGIFEKALRSTMKAIYPLVDILGKLGNEFSRIKIGSLELGERIQVLRGLMEKFYIQTRLWAENAVVWWKEIFGGDTEENKKQIDRLERDLERIDSLTTDIAKGKDFSPTEKTIEAINKEVMARRHNMTVMKQEAIEAIELANQKAIAEEMARKEKERTAEVEKQIADGAISPEERESWIREQAERDLAIAKKSMREMTDEAISEKMRELAEVARLRQEDLDQEASFAKKKIELNKEIYKQTGSEEFIRKNEELNEKVIEAEVHKYEQLLKINLTSAEEIETLTGNLREKLWLETNQKDLDAAAATAKAKNEIISKLYETTGEDAYLDQIEQNNAKIIEAEVNKARMILRQNATTQDELIEAEKMTNEIRLRLESEFSQKMASKRLEAMRSVSDSAIGMFWDDRQSKETISKYESHLENIKKMLALSDKEREKMTRDTEIEIGKVRVESIKNVMNNTIRVLDASARKEIEITNATADQVREIENKTLEKKEEYYKKARQALETELGKSLAEEQRIANEIRSIRQNLADENMSISEEQKKLRRSMMSEEQAYNDRLAEIQQKLADASKLSKEDGQAAIALYKETKSLITGLNSEIKEGDKEILARDIGAQRKIDLLEKVRQGMSNATKTVTDDLEKQGAAAEENSDKIRSYIDQVKEQLDMISGRREVEIMVRLKDFSDAEDQVAGLIKDMEVKLSSLELSPEITFDVSDMEMGDLKAKLSDIESDRAQLYVDLNTAETEEQWNAIKDQINTYTSMEHEIELKISGIESESMGKFREIFAEKEPVEIDLKIDQAMKEMESIHSAFQDIISFSDRKLFVDIDAIKSADGLEAVGKQLVEIQKTTGVIPEFIIDTDAANADLEEQLFKLEEIRRYAKEASELEVDTSDADRQISDMNEQIDILKKTIEWNNEFGIDTSDAEGKIDRLKRKIDELNKAIESSPQSGSGNGGGVPFATGGSVPGPPGAGDVVPAMLTPEEFVQPVPAVKKYSEQFMEAIRRMAIPVENVRALMAVGKRRLTDTMRTAREGLVQNFSGGGSVQMPRVRPITHVTNTFAPEIRQIQRLAEGGSVQPMPSTVPTNMGTFNLQVGGREVIKEAVADAGQIADLMKMSWMREKKMRSNA